MKAIEIVEQIKDILGIELTKHEVKLATMKLDNGTEGFSELFEKDNEIFIVGDDGSKISMPVGDYTMEDSRILTVKTEGIIDEIKEAEAAEEVVEEPVEEQVEAEAEETKVKSKTESTQVVYATKEELDSLVTKIEEIKTLLENQKEEIKDVELTAEAVEPIAHNPEASTEIKNQKSKNNNSQLSRIREMIYNQ